MRFIKNNIKIIIAFIIGIILASSITVYAVSYFAKDITYKDAKTVEDALNDLYKKSNEEKGVDLQNIYYAESSGVQLTNRTCTLDLDKGSYLVFPTFGFASSGWGSTTSENVSNNNYLTGTNDCSIQLLNGKRVYAKGNMHILWTERYVYKVTATSSFSISFCVPISNADNNNGTMVSMYAIKTNE